MEKSVFSKNKNYYLFCLQNHWKSQIFPDFLGECAGRARALSERSEILVIDPDSRDLSNGVFGFSAWLTDHEIPRENEYIDNPVHWNNN